MAIHKDNIHWWKTIRSKFHKSSSHQQNSSSSIIVLHNNDAPFSSEGFNSTANSDDGVSEFLHSREDVAAITIQACFRRHLALRAFKALKGLVKLQALVRGVLVRRQARIALCCMNALARLQITVRSRQLLNAHHY